MAPLVFTANETLQFVNITILDDSVFEGMEIFSLRVMVPAEERGVAVGQRGVANVRIADNDGKNHTLCPTCGCKSVFRIKLLCVTKICKTSGKKVYAHYKRDLPAEL